MPGRIVLYGATGYMGGLTARAMVTGGLRPVLAGRDRGRLDELAARLSQEGAGIELETAVAGAAAGPGRLRELIGAGGPGAGGLLRARGHPEGDKRGHPCLGGWRAAGARIRLPRRPDRDRADRRPCRVVRG